MNNKKLVEKKQMYLFFGLCFFVYYATYLGRLNYSASLAEMINTEGFARGAAGLIGTAFFFSYGLGQLFSGFLGDRLNSKWMVFTGLFISALVNVTMSFLKTPEAMTLVWCLNGFAQSMIWSPLLRSICENLQESDQRRFCIYINYSVPLGTMSAYALTALLINIGGWQLAFLVPSVLVGGMAIIWLLGMGYIEGLLGVKSNENSVTVNPVENKISKKKKERIRIFVPSGLFLLALALCVQGALKDGVTTWIPVYLTDNYNMGSVTAILSTIVIPLCNLAGVSLASVVDKKTGNNEIRSASIFYGICGVALMILWAINGKSAFFAMAMLAVATTTMMSVNTLLVSVLPSRFGKIGRASSVSGILNSCVYAGCASSTYGIGVLSESFGWQKVIMVWVAGAVVAGGICLFSSKKWKRYVDKELKTLKV